MHFPEQGHDAVTPWDRHVAARRREQIEWTLGVIELLAAAPRAALVTGPRRAGARRPPTYEELQQALDLIADLATAPPTFDPPEAGFETLDPPAAS